MAINQKQVLSLQQKLSPQQIQMIKLLELPTVQLEQTSALLVVFLFFSFDSIFTCIYSNQFQSVPKTVLMSLFHLAYFP